MKYLNPEKIGFILLIVLSATLVYLRFKPYVDQPNSSFFDLYGDGFKNYATTLYHIKYDSTYMHYEGMNYPYGEHILFTDCQPILANTLKFISQNILDVSDYTIAIVNLTMLFSFVLCNIFLYLIFNRLKLPIWYNIIISLGLTFLAPQLYRVVGHYGLAHSFVVPAMLYFLMRFEEKRSWTLSALIAVFIMLTAQLHFYFFAISAVMITAYFFFYWLRNFSWQLTGKLALHYGIQVFIPLIFLQFWAHWGDSVRDRPTLPMGFLDFRAFAEGIFTGSKIPFWQWIDRTIVDIRDLNMENEAFVGTVATVFALALIIRWCIRRFKNPFLPYVQSDFLRNLFPAIFIILLFSLGLPFTLPGMSGLLDHLGPFRQFRGLGRFAWAFYFGWNIIVWYSLYQLAANAKKIWIKGIILVPALSLLAYESFYFAKASYFPPWKDERLIQSRFEKSEAYWFKNIDINRYQAVLPIPYYHIGSENFEFGPLGDQLRFSLIPGWHFGIPNLGVFLSRNSYSQTLEHLPLALYPYRPVDLLSLLPNQKPLLVVIDRVQRGNFATKNDFSYLMRQGKLLYADDLVELHELPVDATIKAAELWRSDVRNGWNYAQENFTLRNEIYMPDSATALIRQKFDDQKSEKIYQGKGAFEAPLEKIIPVWEGKLPSVSNTLSIWVYMGEDQHPRINFKGWEIDAEGNEKLIAHNGSRFDVKALDSKGWGYVEFPISVSNLEHRVRLELECKQMLVEKIWLDELLIRPQGKSVFSQQGDWLMYDNYWFENKEN